ncbi:MAG: thioredoxin, partial [Microbacteriaceae bacterium]
MFDLSQAGQMSTPQPSSGAANAPNTFVFDASDANFEEFLELSKRVPVVVDLWATWCGPCKQLSPILEGFASEYQGKFVLVKVDVDQNPGLQRAFQAQSIPTVVALINGQVMPLFVGAQPAAQVKEILDQLIGFAADQGLPGLIPATTEEVAQEPEPLDENHQAAFDAINSGDYDAAIRAYHRALEANPKDQDAAAGLAQVSLLQRLGT